LFVILYRLKNASDPEFVQLRDPPKSTNQGDSLPLSVGVITTMKVIVLI